jgi:glucokinase
MMKDMINGMIVRHKHWLITAIGIACGGPLDPKTGRIMSPPNLLDWDDVDIVTPLVEKFGVPVALRNDADACALAEWRMGAGQGYENLVFLTFGTGMGAGLILNGRLYSGSTGLAGEVGHIRLAENGPLGYGKEGSFEGFCSGGGIARLGRMRALQAIQAGHSPLFCPSIEQLDAVDARAIADACVAGDELAADIYRLVAQYLGRGISLLIDVLNPELIVLGSLYVRQQAILEHLMRKEIEREALTLSAKACRIVPAALGEQLGDYAALCVGMEVMKG